MHMIDGIWLSLVRAHGWGPWGRRFESCYPDFLLEISHFLESEEQKQVAIDYYVNLMRIKAAQTSENKELDYQIKVAKVKLSTFSIDISELEIA